MNAGQSLKQSKNRKKATPEKLSSDFFCRDSIIVAREMVGAILAVRSGGITYRSRIVETEAYKENDPACHAFGLNIHEIRNQSPRQQKRSARLFNKPGDLYIYLNYGMYWLLNFITEPEGIAGAVLIRAVEPCEELPLASQTLRFMAKNRCHEKVTPNLCNGPGKLSLALGITGGDENKQRIWLEEPIRRSQLKCSPRVGISKAQEFLWRYYDADSRFVSVAKENKVSRNC